MRRVALTSAAGNEVLSELVYIRIRETVDVARIALLELDLAESIERCYEGRGGGDDPPSRDLACAMIEQAWRRVEAEWRAGRLRQGEMCALLEADGEPPRRARKRGGA